MRNISRRRLLLSASGFAILAAIPSTNLLAATNQYQQQIDKFVSGNKLSEGQLELDLPEIAENGNLVPLNVSIDSPMTGSDHITSIMVVAAGNPLGGVATFHFSPLSGEASASIRMRLARTQDVIAIAKRNDGACFLAKKTVKVTIGGCGG